MNRITPVVKYLIIINTIMFVGTMPLGQERLMFALFYPETEYFKPYQLVTHMFMHGGVSHILFNMLSLFFLGPMLEQLWGPKRFLKYYFITGLGAAGLHLLVKYIELHYLGDTSDLYVPVLGASGAIYGVFIAFAMYFPNTQLMLLFPPIPIKAKYLAMGLVAWDLFAGMSNTATSIAHFAHIGGALIGFLLIKYWQMTGQKYNRY